MGQVTTLPYRTVAFIMQYFTCKITVLGETVTPILQTRELISIDFNKSLHCNGRRHIQIEGFSLQIPAFHNHTSPLPPYRTMYVSDWVSPLGGYCQHEVGVIMIIVIHTSEAYEESQGQ